MVKLKGPGLSTAAAGTIGDIMTYSSTKGRAYVKKRPTPTQPRSGLQVSMRAMMTFLTKQWKQLTANQQATWKDIYSDTQPNTYNSYLRYNLERWRRRAAPSKAYPATEENVSAEFPAITATGGVRHCVIDVQATMDAHDNWSFLIFHATDDVPTHTVENLITVIRVEDTDHHYWTHSPLAAGTHYYMAVPVADDGNWDPIEEGTDDTVVT